MHCTLIYPAVFQAGAWPPGAAQCPGGKKKESSVLLHQKREGHSRAWQCHQQLPPPGAAPQEFIPLWVRIHQSAEAGWTWGKRPFLRLHPCRTGDWAQNPMGISKDTGTRSSPLPGQIWAPQLWISILFHSALEGLEIPVMLGRFLSKCSPNFGWRASYRHKAACSE